MARRFDSVIKRLERLEAAQGVRTEGMAFIEPDGNRWGLLVNLWANGGKQIREAHSTKAEALARLDELKQAYRIHMTFIEDFEGNNN